MRIPSGKTDQLIFFVAVDSTDLKTRKTGLTTFTVYRSRNGGTATVYTTPTVAELSSANMPGVYSLTIDEDTTIASTSDSEEYCVHITQASMAPVTRTIELYRRDTTTGNQLLVDANGRVDVIKVAGTTQTAKDIGGAVPAAAAGASGGLLISGSNSGTTTLAALTVTGSLTISDGLLVSRSSANTSAATFTGNGTGSGAVFTSGSGATGDGIQATSNATNGNGFSVLGKGTGQGELATGGATGNAMKWVGGATSGAGLLVTTTSGDGFTITPTAGNGITVTANGTSKHGIISTGGTAGTSDGVKFVAGTGGVDLRANQTGNLTGTVATVTTVTNQLTAAAIATGIWQDTTAGDFTTAASIGKSIMNGVALGTGLTVNAVTGLTASNLDTTISSRMATYTQPTGFLAATFPTGTIANTTNITAGTLTTATNLTNAPTAGDFTATMKTSLNAATPTVTVGAIAAAAAKIKKNTAYPKFAFTMTDSTTGAGKTGLTVTGNRSIDGAAFGAVTNTVTEIANGWYYLDLSAADVNGNVIAFQFTATGAVTKDMLVLTQP